MSRKQKKGPSNSQKYKSLRDRRSRRWAKYGEDLENEVEELLRNMQKTDEISRFKHHLKNSPEDHDGKDFTVWKKIEGKEIEHSFGITISAKSLHKAQQIHPHVSQFCWPMGRNPTNMKMRILGLYV